jgi:excisionase family DNA binding protein
MTLKETAAYFRCSDRHIQNLLLKGLPHFRLGSLLRFRRDEVIGFLTSSQHLNRHRQRRVILETLNQQKG